MIQYLVCLVLPTHDERVPNTSPTQDVTHIYTNTHTWEGAVARGRDRGEGGKGRERGLTQWSLFPAQVTCARWGNVAIHRLQLMGNGESLP